jgi:hypothetical protein
MHQPVLDLWAGFGRSVHTIGLTKRYFEMVGSEYKMNCYVRTSFASFGYPMYIICAS